MLKGQAPSKKAAALGAVQRDAEMAQLQATNGPRVLSQLPNGNATQRPVRAASAKRKTDINAAEAAEALANLAYTSPAHDIHAIPIHDDDQSDGDEYKDEGGDGSDESNDDAELEEGADEPQAKKVGLQAC